MYDLGVETTGFVNIPATSGLMSWNMAVDQRLNLVLNVFNYFRTNNLLISVARGC